MLPLFLLSTLFVISQLILYAQVSLILILIVLVINKYTQPPASILLSCFIDPFKHFKQIRMIGLQLIRLLEKVF